MDYPHNEKTLDPGIGIHTPPTKVPLNAWVTHESNKARDVHPPLSLNTSSNVPGKHSLHILSRIASTTPLKLEYKQNNIQPYYITKSTSNKQILNSVSVKTNVTTKKKYIPTNSSLSQSAFKLLEQLPSDNVATKAVENYASIDDYNKMCVVGWYIEHVRQNESQYISIYINIF